MGLIRNAVEQGRQAAAAIAKSGRRGGAGDLDVIVVGAGPAGIAAALGLMAQGLRVQIVEQSVLRRHDRPLPPRQDRDDRLVRAARVRHRAQEDDEQGAADRAVERHPRAHPAAVTEGVRVETIQPEGKAWRVSGGDGTTTARATVVLALGRRGAPEQLGVPGEELPKVAYRLLEPEPFAGKHVMIVGGGNAAADCAIALAERAVRACRSATGARELARLRGSVRTAIERCLPPARSSRCSAPRSCRSRPTRDAEGCDRAHQVPNDDVIVQIGGTRPASC